MLFFWLNCVPSQWDGYDGQDTWEPERSLVKQGCVEVIKEFWHKSKICPSIDFLPDPDDVWRCWCCGKGYKNERTLDAHITRFHPPRQWYGSTADKDARNKMHKDAQDRKEHVQCSGSDLDNVWLFKYLGSLFRADGNQLPDIKARVAMAMVASGKMRNIWASEHIPSSSNCAFTKPVSARS